MVLRKYYSGGTRSRSWACTSSVLTRRLFPNVSELQGRVDGVAAMPRRLDAVGVAVRESTGLAREPRLTASFHTGPLLAQRHAAVRALVRADVAVRRPAVDAM